MARPHKGSGKVRSPCSLKHILGPRQPGPVIIIISRKPSPIPKKQKLRPPFPKREGMVCLDLGLLVWLTVSLHVCVTTMTLRMNMKMSQT